MKKRFLKFLGFYLLAGMIPLISILSKSDNIENETLTVFSECIRSTEFITGNELKMSDQSAYLTNIIVSKSNLKKFIALRRFNYKNIFTVQPKINYSYTQPVISFSGNSGSTHVDTSFLKFLRVTKMLC